MPIKRIPGIAWLVLTLELSWWTSSLFAADLVNRDEPNWWLTPRRMIQTNLREIDAGMHVEAYVASLKAAGANVVLFNVGGIVANYPTDLPYHYRNPFMKGDLTGEAVKRLHAEGIRVIARFDFSKVNERIAREHPEWLTRDADGRSVPAYNGQVPTCLNSWYQQEGMLKVLAEVIERYPIDGVFFNMIGYPRSDYSGRAIGICQCENCRQRFHAMFKLDLPKNEQETTPATDNYKEFTRRTVTAQFEKVNAFVKGRNPNLAICTYTQSGVDVVRKESNSPLDEWVYEESFRTRLARLNCPDKQQANAAVSFPQYPHRHASVSPDLTRKRLFGCMVNGGWLDFYCIGPFNGQEDRIGLDQVEDVFRFHAANERWLTNTAECADVGLAVQGTGQTDEVRGLIGMLSQAHVSYELVSLQTSGLAKLPALIVPVNDPLPASAIQELDNYVKGGGRLLLTGGPLTSELKCLGLSAPAETRAAELGTYIRIRPEDKKRLKQPLLAKLDLVPFSGPLWTATMAQGGEELLRFIPPAMFGPPEKCYYSNVSTIPCLVARRSDPGRVAWIPWRVGTEFETFGHAGHAALVMGALDELLKLPHRVRVNGPALVEMNHRADLAGKFEWVSLYNHSGQLDRVIGAPVPIRDLTLEITPASPVKRARLLKSGESLPLTIAAHGAVTCTVPVLNAYEVVLLEY
ncbi:MAG: alpha-amylase family protein [Thermoguttaceae bacterium]